MTLCKIYSTSNLASAKRKQSAKEIIGVLLHALQLPRECRGYNIAFCIIQFLTFKLDEMATGGKKLYLNAKRRKVSLLICKKFINAIPTKRRQESVLV
jgi:hypothetical protein